jgi:uncharacterized protein YdhG (YjbR/CyaY superfamily)
MKRSAAGKTRDAYLANLPEPARSALKHIRAVIQFVAPKDTPEVIAYGIPRFKFRGRLVGYAAFRDHSSLFPTGSRVIEKFAKELKAYSTNKGTIRFSADQLFADSLPRKIVNARVAENREWD